jgi:hypothetical protein
MASLRQEARVVERHEAVGSSQPEWAGTPVGAQYRMNRADLLPLQCPERPTRAPGALETLVAKQRSPARTPEKTAALGRYRPPRTESVIENCIEVSQQPLCPCREPSPSEGCGFLSASGRVL